MERRSFREGQGTSKNKIDPLLIIYHVYPQTYLASVCTHILFYGVNGRLLANKVA